MWFRLKNRHYLEELEIDQMSRWGQEGVIAIKKNAPINVVFEGATYSFMFAGAQLTKLGWLGLKLPNECVMDEEGTLFCATQKSFVAIGYKRWIKARVHYCAGCGRMVTNLPPFPKKSVGKYELRGERSAIKAQ